MGSTIAWKHSDRSRGHNSHYEGGIAQERIWKNRREENLVNQFSVIGAKQKDREGGALWKIHANPEERSGGKRRKHFG